MLTMVKRITVAQMIVDEKIRLGIPTRLPYLLLTFPSVAPTGTYIHHNTYTFNRINVLNSNQQ